MFPDFLNMLVAAKDAKVALFMQLALPPMEIRWIAKGRDVIGATLLTR
jgi:hypothetical protein